MKRKNKILWFIGFVVTGWFAILIYVFISRRELATNAGSKNGIRTS